MFCFLTVGQFKCFSFHEKSFKLRQNEVEKKEKNENDDVAFSSCIRTTVGVYTIRWHFNMQITWIIPHSIPIYNHYLYSGWGVDVECWCCIDGSWEVSSRDNFTRLAHQVKNEFMNMRRWVDRKLFFIYISIVNSLWTKTHRARYFSSFLAPVIRNIESEYSYGEEIHVHGSCNV